MSITITKPSIKRADMDAVLTCLVNDTLAPGSQCQRLAHEIASYLGVEGGFALREYPRALGLALDGLGLKPGARVLLSPLCPEVYDRVLAEKGLEPLFVDVDPETGCLSPEAIERLEGQAADAMVCHYTLGFVPQMDELAGFGIPIIEDLSQALGANTGTKRAGTYGSFTVISLEAENIITAGGGALVLGTGRREVSLLKHLVETLGRERSLPDMNAALGLTQIKDLERFVSRRREIAQVYLRSLAQSRHRTLVQGGEAENVHYSFPILIDKGLKDVQSFARKKGVETHPAFAESILARLAGRETEWPTAYGLFLRCLLFPLYPTLGKHNVDTVQKVVGVLP